MPEKRKLTNSRHVLIREAESAEVKEPGLKME